MNGVLVHKRDVLRYSVHGTRHELAGRNHHALVDAQQTRLMFWSFIALCKDLSAPDKPFQYKDDRGVRQKSLLDYFPRV